MTKPKFTPDPWRIDGHENITQFTDGRDCLYAIVRSDGERWTALVEVSDDEGEANASLIASAPALYAALHECFTEPFAHCLVNEDKDALYRRICAINDTVRAALALARGGVVDGQGVGVDSGRGEKGGE